MRYVYLALKVGRRRRGHRFHSSLEHDKEGAESICLEPIMHLFQPCMSSINGGSGSSAPSASALSRCHCCSSNVVPSKKLRWNVEIWGCRFQCSIVAVGTMIRLWSKLWVPSSDVLLAPGAQLMTAWCCMRSQRSVRANCSKSVAW